MPGLSGRNRPTLAKFEVLKLYKFSVEWHIQLINPLFGKKFHDGVL